MSARQIWSIIPADCKSSLARLQELGKMQEARPAIIAEAERQLARLPGWSNLDCCHALEHAARAWLEARRL